MVLRGELEQGDVALVEVEGGRVVIDAVRRRGTRASA
jgi:hypothetical protein